MTFYALFDRPTLAGFVANWFRALALLGLSSQLSTLWWAGFLDIVWIIWSTHNFACHGTMVPTISLRKLGVVGVSRSFKGLVLMVWVPTLLGWVKINMDGAFSRSSRLAAMGGVFRDSDGRPLYAFSSPLFVYSSFEVELCAVVHAVNKALGHFVLVQFCTRGLFIVPSPSICSMSCSLGLGAHSTRSGQSSI